MHKEIKKITIISCLDCPWCWFANEEILQLNNPLYSFEWVPFILKQNVNSDGESFHSSAKSLSGNWSDKQIDDYANSQQMKETAQSLGFPWVHRDTRYNVINASIFAMYAREKEVVDSFITEVFRAYFQAKNPDNRNVSSIHVLEEIAKKIGLNKSDVKQVMSDKKYKAILEEVTNKYPLVHSVPTYVYKDRVRAGFFSKESFVSFLEEFTDE